MSKKLGFSVIGCGRMGLRRMRTIMEHPDTELISVADNEEEKARETGRKMGCDYYFGYEEAINKPNVGCVIISVPNKFHLPITVLALNQGKHVWCEKPMARNPDEGIKMVEAAMGNKVFLKVGSNLRYFPNVQKTKEWLDKAEIGEILYIRGWIGNSGWALSKPWFSDPEMSGGGTLLDNGCHLFDIYRWFLGEAETCTGQVSRLYHPIKLEDNGFGIFEFMNGAVAFIQSSWTQWVDYMYMEIYGTEGYIKVDSINPNCKAILGRKDGYQQVYDFSRLPPQSYNVEFDDFMKSLHNGTAPEPSGFDGLRAVQMAHGVYESARLGKKVKIWGEREEKLLKLLKRRKK